ncbi:MAG TPA: TrkA C-terminal domain-containing protein, partial [Acidimicrobiia bacterium]|nr:TrkA C-terminal domain-containing protein [Acidimicrobiia bacterium]
VLVSALPTDADNLYVVLSGRAARADLHIVARARSESSEAKLQLAGADRVINPQEIGGRRMAAFALQPAVSEFLDVVVHGAGEVAYRLEEIEVPAQAALAGCSIRDAHIRDQTGALVLALRDGAEHFVTNPGPDTLLGPGMTIIAIGTDDQLQRLRAYVAAGRTASDPSTVDARATRE